MRQTREPGRFGFLGQRPMGAKKPVPNDTRLDPAVADRINAATRGLTNVPNSLCTSSRPLADTASHGVTSHIVLREDARHRERVREPRARRVDGTASCSTAAPTTHV